MRNEIDEKVTLKKARADTNRPHIADDIGFQQALTRLIDAELLHDKTPKGSPLFAARQEAAGAAWDAVCAVADAFLLSWPDALTVEPSKEADARAVETMNGSLVEAAKDSLSPGAQYVADYLPTASDDLGEWVALALDGTLSKRGRPHVQFRLAICPRCAFLMRPGLACDVCAHVGIVRGELFAFSYDGGDDKRLADSPVNLIQERVDCAEILHELYRRVISGAEALCVEAMREALIQAEARYSEPSEGGPA